MDFQWVGIPMAEAYEEDCQLLHFGSFAKATAVGRVWSGKQFFILRTTACDGIKAIIYILVKYFILEEGLNNTYSTLNSKKSGWEKIILWIPT